MKKILIIFMGIIMVGGVAHADVVSTQYLNAQLLDKATVGSVTTVANNVGDINALATSDKTSVVGAINSVNTVANAAKATADTAVQGFTNSGTGYVVTGVTDKGTVTRGNVQIPVGSATATTYAQIWVE